MKTLKNNQKAMAARPLASSKAAQPHNPQVRKTGAGQHRPRTVSRMNNVQLNRCEDAWRPSFRKGCPAKDPAAQRTEELLRKVRSILNKITPEKFDKLLKQLMELEVDTKEKLDGVVELIFEKAVDEPHFSAVYGRLSRCLANLTMHVGDDSNSSVDFRTLLLRRGQREFQGGQMDAALKRKQKDFDSAATTTEREQLQQELDDMKNKARRRSAGTSQFIGQLFKETLLPQTVILSCVSTLLKKQDDVSLECLSRLLTTAGKDLDAKNKTEMDQFCSWIIKIIREKKVMNRTRFMLMDVIELRMRDWVPRRPSLGPKTIQQIHKEAEMEEQEEQRKVQQLLSKNSKRQTGTRQDVPKGTRIIVSVTKSSKSIKTQQIFKPQADNKSQQGLQAKKTWAQACAGRGPARVSVSSEVSQTADLKQDAVLPSRTVPQPSTAPPQHPDQLPALGSGRSDADREDKKPVISAPPASRPAPLVQGGHAEGQQDGQRQEKLPGNTKGTEKKEPSRVTEPVKAEPVAPTPVKPALSEEVIERKSKSIMDEFLHIKDYKEAAECLDELHLGPQLNVFVRVGVDLTLERSQSSRDHMGQLLFQLVQQGVLPKAQFYKGFTDILEQAEDLSIDLPHFWTYLAQLLSPVMKEGGFSMKELFSELSKPLLPMGLAGTLMSGILHRLCEVTSQQTVASLWEESGLSWTDVLPEGEDVQAFIAEQKLQFLQPDSSKVQEAPAAKMSLPEELIQQLERLLLEDVASNQQIFDWIEANLDEPQLSSSSFVRALMTAVCQATVRGENASCRMDTIIFKKKLPVLFKYLNSDSDRQLQALYALQVHFDTLHQPPHLLRMFFDIMFDRKLISSEVFYKWQMSSDPAEQQGKDVALKAVKPFFTWLRIFGNGM